MQYPLPLEGLVILSWYLYIIIFVHSLQRKRLFRLILWNGLNTFLFLSTSCLMCFFIIFLLETLFHNISSLLSYILFCWDKTNAEHSPSISRHKYSTQYSFPVSLNSFYHILSALVIKYTFLHFLHICNVQYYNMRFFWMNESKIEWHVKNIR